MRLKMARNSRSLSSPPKKNIEKQSSKTVITLRSKQMKVSPKERNRGPVTVTRGSRKSKRLLTPHISSVSTRLQSKLGLRGDTSASHATYIVRVPSKPAQQVNKTPSTRKGAMKRNLPKNLESHGPAGTIRCRRESKEFSRKTQSTTQVVLSQDDSSTALNVNAAPACPETVTVESKKKDLQCSKSENSEGSCSSYECQSRPCRCPEPDNLREICVIKKCEMWLHTRVVSPDMAPVAGSKRQGQDDDSMTKRVRYIDVESSEENEFNNLQGFRPTETLLSVQRAPFPCFNIQVKIKRLKPILTIPTHLVRGVCPQYGCSAVYPIIDWTKSGPLNFGKVLRPYCQRCLTKDTKSYLDIFFYLELSVTDSDENEAIIIVQRDQAMRFFGCTVHRFLINQGLRSHVVGLLNSFVKKYSPDPLLLNGGRTISLSVVSVAHGSVDDQQYHLFGDNWPLNELLKKVC